MAMFRLAELSKRNVPLTNTSKKFYFNWGIKIPMRDGVDLNATIYRPKVLWETKRIRTHKQAHITLYHDSNYLSYLEIPIAR